MPNPLPLQNRVALITGVSRQRGIGFAIAKELAAQGANLFVQALPAYDQAQAWGGSDLPTLLADLGATGAEVGHIVADFAAADSAHQVMQAAVAAFGHVDIVVANHAYSTNGALEQLTAADIDQHFSVNVRSTLLLIQAFAAQHQDDRAGGRVILLTTGQGLMPMTGELAYAASKGALQQITLSLSAHLIRRLITVNAVNPGPTDTGYASAEAYEAVRAASPQGRWGQPDDAARLIAWLASDEAQWVTGQVIHSTGGFLG
jgi:3-oxoacyl-[acyl-carrier protein] reductase